MCSHTLCIVSFNKYEQLCDYRIAVRIFTSGNMLISTFSFLINEKSYDKYTNSDEYIEYFVAIHLYFRDKFVFGDNSMESISYGGQYDIPTHGAKSREKNKFGEFHTCQSCRYRNKLTYSRYQSSDEGGYTTMLVEIAFGCFDFFWSSRQICPMRLLANL